MSERDTRIPKAQIMPEWGTQVLPLPDRNPLVSFIKENLRYNHLYGMVSYPK